VKLRFKKLVKIRLRVNFYNKKVKRKDKEYTLKAMPEKE
jgi:hypothetical protein